MGTELLSLTPFFGSSSRSLQRFGVLGGPSMLDSILGGFETASFLGMCVSCRRLRTGTTVAAEPMGALAGFHSSSSEREPMGALAGFAPADGFDEPMGALAGFEPAGSLAPSGLRDADSSSFGGSSDLPPRWRRR